MGKTTLATVAFSMIVGIAHADFNPGTCTYNGIPLFGKVQFVEAFSDLTIEVVTAIPDLRVQLVDAFPDECGEWQEVDAFPDFTVQVVDAFGDLRVEFVDAFPGVPGEGHEPPEGDEDDSNGEDGDDTVGEGAAASQRTPRTRAVSRPGVGAKGCRTLTYLRAVADQWRRL